MIIRRHVQHRSGLVTVERLKPATATISPDLTATSNSGCTSGYSCHSDLFALASVLGIAVIFVGISLQIIDFPLAAHADEGSKVLQIQQSSYNYNHPLLMLELAHAANAVAGLSNPQSVVELGRALAVIAGGFAIFATFLLAGEVLPRLAALAATLTVAVVPALTVHARYFKEDIFMLPFLLLALVVLIRMLKAPTRSSSIILGGLIGLAAAAKYVAIIVLPFALLLLLLEAILNQEWWIRLTFAGLVTLSTLGVMMVIQIPALLDFTAFSSALAGDVASAVAGQEVRLPVSRTLGLFHLTNSLLPSLGLPVLILGLTGLATPWLVPSERRQPLLVIALFALLWYAVHEFSPFKPYPDFMRYMVPLAPLLIILGTAFVYELGRRHLSRPASLGLASAVILTAGIPALYLSLRISAPAQEDPRRIISDLDFDNPTRTAFDRYTRYVGPLGVTDVRPATADIFVTSSFTYDRFGAISTSHGQSRRTRQRRAFYAALFNEPYLDVTNGRPAYAYFNPIIRIVALDGDAGRLVPIAAALRRAAPSFSVRFVNTPP